MRLFTVSPVLLACLTATTSAFAASPSPTFQLKYFDARGAAETIRVLLAVAGEKYDDTRFGITPGTMDSPDFKAAKESGELISNLNRAPVLVTPEGVSIGQSKAIERYIATKCNLMGSSDTEAALVDCIAEHCRDVKDAERRKGFSFFVKDKTEEEKEAARKEWYEVDLPVMLEKIDECVKVTGTEGFAVGSKVSYADVVVWGLLRDCSEKDLADTNKAAEKCKALNKIADGVASDPKVIEWLKERPVTMF